MGKEDRKDRNKRNTLEEKTAALESCRRHMVCTHTQLLKNGLILSVGATVKKVHFRQRARFLVPCCSESAPASSACHERTQFFPVVNNTFSIPDYY